MRKLSNHEIFALASAFAFGLLLGVPSGMQIEANRTPEAVKVFRHLFGSAASPAKAKKAKPPPKPQRTWSARELSVPGEYTVTSLSYDSTRRGGVYYVHLKAHKLPGESWQQHLYVEIPEADFTPAEVKRIIRQQIERVRVRRHNRQLLRR